MLQKPSLVLRLELGNKQYINIPALVTGFEPMRLTNASITSLTTALP